MNKTYTIIYKKIRNSLRNRGIYGTLTTVVSRYHHRLLFRHLDIWGKVYPHEMNGPDNVKLHAARYEASNPGYFKRLLENIDWNFSNSIFVDFGCGKGASMIFAAKMKFKKVIGIEFCQDLSKVAHHNMQRHIDKMKSDRPQYEVINIDASQYEIPKDADCFYFFNPFDSYILDKVMRNIMKSVLSHERKILIIYMNAVHSGVVEHYPLKKIKFIPTEQLDAYYSGGAAVYEYDPEEQRRLKYEDYIYLRSKMRMTT